MNSAKLRGIMAEKGKTGKAVANYIGVSDKTFYTKLKNGKLGVDEARKIQQCLEISDALFIEIFLSD